MTIEELKLIRLRQNIMPVIYSATLIGAANAITLTVDRDGEELNLKSASLFILVPAGSSAPVGASAYIEVRINDIATGYRDPGNSSDNGTYFSAGHVRNLYGLAVIDMCVMENSGLIAASRSAYSDGTSRKADIVYQAALMSGVPAINKIYVFLSGGYTFPIGTMIELRGAKI